jgi:hypothetical protein
MHLITAAISLVSVIIGGIIGGSMSLVASLKATERAYKYRLKLQEQSRKEDVKNLIQALHDEIDILWERYLWGVGNELEKLDEGEPLLRYYPVTQEYFIVYKANASLIGSIENHELRKEIVTIYSKVKSLFDSYKINNNYLQRYDYLNSLFQQIKNPFFGQQASAIRILMIDRIKKIKLTHDEIKQDIKSLLEMLKKEFA